MSIKSYLFTLGWLSAFLSGLPAPVSASEPVYLAVYEPEIAAHDDIARSAQIRLPFMFRDGRWLTLPQEANTPDELKALPAAYPRSISLRDFRSGVQFTGTIKPWKVYGAVGSYDPVPPAPAALLIKDNAFETWNGVYKYRPFVLTSAAIRPASPLLGQAPLSADDATAVLKALRANHPTYTACHEQEGKGYAKAWSDSDVVFSTVLQGKDITVVAASFKDKLNICQGPDGYPDANNEVSCDFCSHWFVVDRDHRVRFIGSSLTFLDYGDFGNDGETEWLFTISGYNRDGYALFTKGFTTRALYLWSYH